MKKFLLIAALFMPLAANAQVTQAPPPKSVVFFNSDPNGYVYLDYSDGTIFSTNFGVNFARQNDIKNFITTANTATAINNAIAAQNLSSLYRSINDEQADVQNLQTQINSLSSATAPVSSVNGKTGAVSLAASDVGAYAAGNPSGFVTAAQAASASPVQSVNSKTGSVTLSSSDVGAYAASNPSGFVNAAQAGASAPVQSVAGLTGAPTVAQIISALGIGTAGFQPSSAFYPSSNPLGFISSAPVSSVNSKTGAVTLSASDVGAMANTAAAIATALGFTPYNAANPSGYQTASQVSAAVNTEAARAQSAEALLAPLASPALTGSPTAPTQAAGDNSTKLATTAFVAASIPPAPCTTGSKISCGIGTTAASTGAFTATLSPPCNAAPTVVLMNAKAAGSLLSNSVNASEVSRSATSVSGIATSPATLTVLGLTVVAPPTGTQVNVLAVCP